MDSGKFDRERLDEEKLHRVEFVRGKLDRATLYIFKLDEDDSNKAQFDRYCISWMGTHLTKGSVNHMIGKTFN